MISRDRSRLHVFQHRLTALLAVLEIEAKWHGDDPDVLERLCREVDNVSKDMKSVVDKISQHYKNVSMYRKNQKDVTVR